MPYVTVFLCLLILLTACSHSPAGARRITMADRGAEIDLAVGSALRLELDSNPTTGFSWEITAIDAARLRLLEQGYDGPSAQDHALTGAGGQQWWEFSALSAGSSELALVYRRPWETRAAPADSFSVRLRIAGPRG